MIKSLNTKKTAFFLLATLAIVIQVQISLFAQDNYLGLRINLADFFLPFAGIFVLCSLISGTTNWPKWSDKHVPYLLFSLLAVLTIALINGYVRTGSWSSWALINKYCGFIILICYFLLAGWIVTNFGKNKALHTFVKFFCATYIITLILSIIDVIQRPYTGTSLWIGDFRWDGFLANRNVYMVTATLTTICLLTYSQKEKYLLPFWMPPSFWLILPTFVIYNASRTGWIFGALIFAVYLFKAPLKFLREILPFLALGTILAFAIFNYLSPYNVKNNQQFERLTTVIQQTTTKESPDYYGDQKRLIALEDGLDLYLQSNPVIGAGLGAYKPFQIEKRGKYIDVIDWSALWLLTETGLLGLGSFSAFFLLGLFILYKKGFKEESTYHRAMFFFLIVIIAMSFLHELLYTRFLWFALGLAMAESKNDDSTV